MTDNVLPFPKPQARKIRVPPADELTRKVRRMLRFNRMLMPRPQMQEWLSAKGVTLMQVLSTIKQGEAASEPIMNSNGDWQITLKRVAAGRRTRVSVAVKADHFVLRNIS